MVARLIWGQEAASSSLAVPTVVIIRLPTSMYDDHTYGLNMRDCRATEYTEYDTTDLEDGTVVRMAQHSFFKLSNLGGWISYTGNTHSDEEMAKILKSTIAPIHVYVH